MMKMKIDYTSYKDVDLKGKKIIMRVDINSNIDMEKYEIRESPRITALVPALNELKDSAIILIAHQSRPGSKDFTDLDIHAKEIEKCRVLCRIDRRENYRDSQPAATILW